MAGAGAWGEAAGAWWDAGDWEEDAAGGWRWRGERWAAADRQEEDREEAYWRGEWWTFWRGEWWTWRTTWTTSPDPEGWAAAAWSPTTWTSESWAAAASTAPSSEGRPRDSEEIEADLLQAIKRLRLSEG